jgi:hypothetical protein
LFVIIVWNIAFGEPREIHEAHEIIGLICAGDVVSCDDICGYLGVLLHGRDPIAL